MKKVLWSLIAALVLTVMLLPQKAMAAAPDEYELVEIQWGETFDSETVKNLTQEQLKELLVWYQLQFENNTYYYIPYAFNGQILNCIYYKDGQFATDNLSIVSASVTATGIMDAHRKNAQSASQNPDHKFYRVVRKDAEATSREVNGRNISAYIVRTMGGKTTQRNISGYVDAEKSSVICEDKIATQGYQVVDGLLDFKGMTATYATDKAVFLIDQPLVSGYQDTRIQAINGKNTFTGTAKFENDAHTSVHAEVDAGISSGGDWAWVFAYKIYYEVKKDTPATVSVPKTETREEVEETPGPTKEELDVQKVTQYGDTAAVIPGGIPQATIKLGGNEITLNTSGVTTKTPTTSYVSAPPKTDPVGQTLTAFANLLSGGQCLSMTRYQLFTSGKPVIGKYGTITVDMQITSASEGQEVLVVIWGPDGGVRYEKVKVTNGRIPVLLAEHSYVAVYALNQGQLKK